MPASPPDGPVPYAGYRETHSGVVILLGDQAYKVKKPVDLGFLDFTSQETRLAACRREVELNRRLAPDVYQGVADIVGPDGRPSDHLVVMRRMPDDRRLSTLVASGMPLYDEMRRLARLIAAFHTAADRGSEISAEGGQEALRERWAANLTQARPFYGVSLDAEATDEVERLALRFLAGREALFAARIAAGRVIDGHGDLLADDIFCLDDGPRVLDCLEYDDRLRWLDGLDDVAFLVMDLERLGAPGLGEAFLGWYVEFAADPAPPSLRHHYVAYRAFVRAKVACLRHEQGEVAAAVEARELTDLARRHLESGAVTLVLVGGLPGAGKSTVAGGLADHLECALLNSDRVRKELAGLPPEQPASAPYGAGVYSAEWTGRTYTELLARTRGLLARGESVVLDASWTVGGERAAAAEVAAETHADLVALRCVAPVEVAAARLAERRVRVSDADAQIAAEMAATAAPWPEATVIDTSGDARDALRRALGVVRPALTGLTRPRRPQIPPDGTDGTG